MKIMTREEIKQICRIYDGLRAERDAATIAYNSEDTFWEHVLVTYNLSQPPTLSNLDEAARDYCNSQPGWENKMDWVEEKDKEECRRDFKAGAEWMARQGETVEGEVVSTSSDGWECVRLYKKLHSVDDKVIVQIRKK